jgi:hypothetical protein
MAYKKFNNSTLRYTTMPWIPFGLRSWAEKVLGNASEIHDLEYTTKTKPRKEVDKNWLKQVKQNARQESGYFEKFTIYLAGVVGYAIIKTFGGLWWKR